MGGEGSSGGSGPSWEGGGEAAGRFRALGERFVSLGVDIETTAGRFAASQGLHPTDVRALRALAGPDAPLTAGELGARLDLTSGAATRAVDRLERLGHVERVRDPADRRRALLRLTPEARSVAEAFFGGFAARMDEALRGFSEPELDAVARFLSLASEAMRAERGGAS